MSREDELQILELAERAIRKCVEQGFDENEICALCFAAGIPTPEMEHGTEVQV